jgi:hypothetical protein
MIPNYLTPLLKDSIVKKHKRGTRRYFPLKAKTKRGWKYLYEAFYIIYGREAKEKTEIGMAILSNGLETYVERFDGKLWVRTICVN